MSAYHGGVLEDTCELSELAHHKALMLSTHSPDFGRGTEKRKSFPGSTRKENAFSRRSLFANDGLQENAVFAKSSLHDCGPRLAVNLLSNISGPSDAICKSEHLSNRGRF